MAGQGDSERRGSGAAEELADAWRGEGGEDAAIAGLSWADWPNGLDSRARQVVDEVEAGHPVEALSVLDEMISDLAARRQTVAELANAED